MIAYRVVNDGAVIRCTFTPMPGGYQVERMQFMPGEHLIPGPGAPYFWQVEQYRPGKGLVVVAMLVGPRLPDLYEPDWSKAALAVVLNPMSALDYGGKPSIYRPDRETYAPKQRKAPRAIAAKSASSEADVTARGGRTEAQKAARRARRAERRARHAT